MKTKDKNNTNIAFSNENPFICPEGYFDTLTERIINRVESEKQTSKTKIIRILKPALAFAASFAIIFILIYIPASIIGNRTSYSETTEQEILDLYYVNDHVLVNTFETETQDDYNEDLMEKVLLASVSDMELLEF
jgi:hypothetical protein